MIRRRFGTVPHGTYNGYLNYGCRCRSCTVANTDHQNAYNLRRRLPLDPDVALLNVATIRARVLTWQAVHAAGVSVRVCDEIIRNRPIPARLYAAVLAADLEAAA